MVNLVLLLCLLGLCGYGCYALSKLPESVAVVQKPEPVDAEDVHDNNTTSEEITETEHLRYIAEGAFRGCTALGELHLGSQVTQIDEHAFEGCDRLRVICPKNSNAAQYCELHGIPYTIQ